MRYPGLAACVVWLAACGSPSLEDLSSLEHPEYTAGYFGINSADQGRCDIEAQVCWGSKTRSPRVKFYASTCSSWWQGRAVDAWYWLQDELASVGWTLQGESSSGAFDIKMRCGSTQGKGSAQPVASYGWETTIMPNGVEWREPNRWEIVIDSSEIQSSPAWAAATSSQRSTFAVNIWKHELSHAFGHGHQGTPGYITQESINMDFTTGYEWNRSLGYRTEELWWMECYNPSDATNPRC